VILYHAFIVLCGEFCNLVLASTCCHLLNQTLVGCVVMLSALRHVRCARNTVMTVVVLAFLEVQGFQPVTSFYRSEQLTKLMHKLFYNKFVIFLYMFRALLCSSSGGQNFIIQHLVSSHTVGDRLVCRLRESSINPCTVRPPTECDDTRCCIIQFDFLMMSTIMLETCRGI